jgi:hypothetical protein
MAARFNFTIESDLAATDHNYLLEIEDDTLGFLNQTPKSIINHLRSQGGELDFVDTKTLLAERDAEWDVSEVPQNYFNRVEQTIKGLTRAGIVFDLNERRDVALYYLKASGKFDAAVCKWEQKSSASKTWTNIKTFIATEFARVNKQNKLTAKQYKANTMEEQAEATEDLIVNLTERHTRQMETLIKNTTEALKEMMALVKSENKPSENKPLTNNNDMSKGGRKKRTKERCKMYINAPIHKHCNRKHPAKKEDECWKLEANAASCPSYWKPSKST